MKARTLRLSFLPLLVSLAGCSAADDGSLGTGETSAASTTPVVDIAATKQKLLEIALQNLGRTNNFSEVRAEVDPLISQLERQFGQRPALEKVPLVEGAWRQVWSDFPYPMAPFLSMDPGQIYQVVSAKGHYWNIGDQRAVGFLGLTGVLRGTYLPEGATLRIQFTDVGFRFGTLSKDQDLPSLADGLESREQFYIPVPGTQAPRGPVGIKGTLETVYVDNELRIDRGSQDDFLDGDGKVLVPGFTSKVFILQKVERPVK